jgi:hypothetical protein
VTHLRAPRSGGQAGLGPYGPRGLGRVLFGAVVLVAWALSVAACRGAGERIDLIERLNEAQKVPDAATFVIEDHNLAGEAHRAIAVVPVLASRLTWRLTVPKRAWLWVSIGMQVEAWNNEGDGVRFTAGVNDGGTFVRLFEQYLHPYALAGDRKWFPIRVSLAKYEGREIELVFATATGADGAGEDRRHDLPLWGIPEIVVR